MGEPVETLWGEAVVAAAAAVVEAPVAELGALASAWPGCPSEDNTTEYQCRCLSTQCPLVATKCPLVAMKGPNTRP